MVIMKSYGVITRSYRREREWVGIGIGGNWRDYDSIMKSYRRERKGAGTIGLDWLGIGCGEGWGGGWGIPAGLIPLAWPSPPSIPHSPLP